MRKRTKTRNENKARWEAHTAQTRARWAEAAAAVDRTAEFNPTKNFARCEECGVHTRKGLAAREHAKRHEAEAAAERVRRGDRVVRV